MGEAGSEAAYNAQNLSMSSAREDEIEDQQFNNQLCVNSISHHGLPHSLRLRNQETVPSQALMAQCSSSSSTGNEGECVNNCERIEVQDE